MRPAQSLIELLIAVGAISVVLVALASVSTRAVSTQISAKFESRATQLLEEQMEQLRAYRDRNGYATLVARSCSVPASPTGCTASTCVVSSALGSYQITTGSVTTDGIAVCLGTSTSGSCPGSQIQVTAMAQWTDAKGSHYPTIKTCLTDWKR